MKTIFIISIIVGVISVISFILCAMYSVFNLSSCIIDYEKGVYSGVQDTLLSYGFICAATSIFLAVVGIGW